MAILLVDRVIELVHAERIEACYSPDPTHPFLKDHFPQYPVVPGAILLEVLAQAGSILLEVSFEFQCKALPGYFENAKFRSPVPPGEELRITLTSRNWSDQGAVLTGSIQRRGRPMVTATMGLVCAPIQQFFAPAHLPFYRATYRRWLEGAVLVGFKSNPLEVLPHEVS